MTAIFWNISLALIWVMLTNSFNLYNFLLGFVIAWVILVLMQRHTPVLHGYGNRLLYFISFIGFFFKELFIANIRVSYDVLTPESKHLPGIIAYPVNTKTDLELLTLGSFISLTPGTLLMDVSEDRCTMYVHVMFLQDEAQVYRDLAELERRILQIMR